MLQSTSVDDIRRAGWFEMPNFLLHTSSATNKPFRAALPCQESGKEGGRERFGGVFWRWVSGTVRYGAVLAGWLKKNRRRDDATKGNWERVWLGLLSSGSFARGQRKPK